MNAPIAVGDLDRRKYLGGSDIAAVCGLSPWMTPLDLFYKKLSVDPEEITPEKAKFFRNRKAQEPIIAARLEREYGIVVTRLSMDEDPNRYKDPEHEYFAAEIDFEFEMTDAVRDNFPARPDFAAIPNGTLLNGEIKTVHPFTAAKWGEAGSEDLPVEYAAQAMWGLGITRRPACLVAALFGIDELICFPVMVDQETLVGMRSKAVKFWTENILANVPPDPVNVEDVVKLFAGFKGRPVDLSDDAYEALRQLDVVRGNIRAMEGSAIDLEWRVARCVAFAWSKDLEASKSKKPVITADENAVLMYDGTQAGTWNRQSRTGIDTPLLKKEQPVIASQYATTSEFRVFRLKKPKGT